jgi:carbonic anhydrase
MPAIETASNLQSLTEDGSDTSNGVTKENSRLYKMLAYNSKYLDWVSAAGAPAPQPLPEGGRRSVVITCMDARLVELLPKALNLRHGDTKVIKTAGAILTHPFGGIMRSVVVAIYLLRADEVFVVGQ